jgi:hypothetical protein
MMLALSTPPPASATEEDGREMKPYHSDKIATDIASVATENRRRHSNGEYFRSVQHMVKIALDEAFKAGARAKRVTPSPTPPNPESK